MQYGALREAPRVRNYTYTGVYGASKETLPTEFTLPPVRLPEVGDQGNVRACVAFAATGILDVFFRMEFGRSIRLSPSYVYGRHRDGDYTGMYPQKVADALCKLGSVPRNYFDKLYEMPHQAEIVAEHPGLDELAKKYRIKGYVTFNGTDTAEMRRALYEKQYPILAVSDSYFGGRHAILLIGWTENGWMIQNSWGEDWEDGGRAEIPFDAVETAYLFTDEVMQMPFKDVARDAWYYDAVKECVFSGLMQGTSDTTFEPDRPPTRAELAQLTVNLSKKLDEVIQNIS